jgi:hypothetical protein
MMMGNMMDDDIRGTFLPFSFFDPRDEIPLRTSTTTQILVRA